MIEESGKVVAVDGHFVWIETIRKSACQSCSMRAGCGHSVIANAGGEQKGHVRARNPNGCTVAVGDHVVLGIKDETITRSALLVYGMPLLFMVFGALGGEGLQRFTGLVWVSADAAAALGAFVGLVLGFVAIKVHSIIYQDDDRFEPRVLRQSVLKPACH